MASGAVTKPSLTWSVGALCRAIADALEARFNPVTVRGEVCNFSAAGSGHWYFSLKDDSGQLRCVMFRRAASLVGTRPRDGDLVEVHGRLTVYEQRGDVQLVVESLRAAGQGALFEEFLRIKARLEADGCFDPARKRPVPAQPRAIGLVTSLDAAALHDVVTALRRRVPHIPVVLAPAQVQGVAAPAELVRALSALYRLARDPGAAAPAPPIDVILLVRGGGSMEDLWAFNSEPLARLLADSPVPVISGIGHETDFTIADFCADLRAPTPTAAAELVAQPREELLAGLERLAGRLEDALVRRLDREAQRLDSAGARIGRPSALVARHRAGLQHLGQALHRNLQLRLQAQTHRLERLQADFAPRFPAAIDRSRRRVEHAATRLGLLDPRLVLERGYAWLADEAGQPITSAGQARAGQAVRATLADGTLDLTVQSAH